VQGAGQTGCTSKKIFYIHSPSISNKIIESISNIQHLKQLPWSYSLVVFYLELVKQSKDKEEFPVTHKLYLVAGLDFMSSTHNTNKSISLYNYTYIQKDIEEDSFDKAKHKKRKYISYLEALTHTQTQSQSQTQSQLQS
jgi:hypothetical protein